MIERALEKLARFEERRPFVVIGLFVLFTIIIMSGFGLITSESGFEDFVPDDVEAIVAINEIRDKLGSGSDNILLLAKTDPEDPRGLRDIRDIRALEQLDLVVKQFEQNEFVIRSSSILPLVKENGVFLEQHEINDILQNDNPNVAGLLATNYDITLVRFDIEQRLSQAQKEDVVEDVQKIVRDSDRSLGLELLLAGQVYNDIEVAKTIGSSTGLVTLVGFAGVFIFLYILFRRIGFVIVTVIPVLFGTIWTFGTLGIVGIPLSTALVGVFSMIIGIGIDFGIHIVHRFEEDRHKYKLEKAVANAVMHVGKGLTLTAITTIIGFLALLTAVLPALQDMAIALAFGVFYSLMAAIGFIPAVLVVIEKFKAHREKKKQQKLKHQPQETRMPDLLEVEKEYTKTTPKNPTARFEKRPKRPKQAKKRPSPKTKKSPRGRKQRT